MTPSNAIPDAAGCAVLNGALIPPGGEQRAALAARVDEAWATARERNRVAPDPFALNGGRPGRYHYGLDAETYAAVEALVRVQDNEVYGEYAAAVVAETLYRLECEPGLWEYVVAWFKGGGDTTAWFWARGAHPDPEMNGPISVTELLRAWGRAAVIKYKPAPPETRAWYYAPFLICECRQLRREAAISSRADT